MAKPSEHTPKQIVDILRQIEVAVANGKTHPIASPETGITEQTYYRRRGEYGGLKVSQAKRQRCCKLPGVQPQLGQLKNTRL